MSPESESDVLPLHQSAIIRMEGIEPSTFGLSDQRSDLLSYIREVIVGFEPTITVLQTVVLTTWRYDPNVAYRTRTYNRKIRNLLHYPIMLMPQSRCDRIRTCIRRFWRPLHIHSCSTPVKFKTPPEGFEPTRPFGPRFSRPLQYQFCTTTAKLG